MSLDSLELIQDGIRSLDTIRSMIKYVRRGGIFHDGVVYDTVSITEFPDGRRIIHDGLHRCLSLYLCKKSLLLPNEYHIKYWDYEHYNQISVENGYFTPFNPRCESRLADFGEFKQVVKDMLDNPIIDESIEEFILNHQHMYKTNKNYYNLSDLAEVIMPKLNGLYGTRHRTKQLLEI